MRWFSICVAFCYIITGAVGLIIPEELPSLLSIIYSNIPPVKKGTDSRVGFGFRLGPHADFQVQLELGPQTNTNPIGPDAAPPSKRQTLTMQNTNKLVDYVNNFRTNFKNLRGRLAGLAGLAGGGGGGGGGIFGGLAAAGTQPPKSDNTVSDTAGGKWIDQWQNTLFSQNPVGKIQFDKVPGIDDMSAQGSERVDTVWSDPTMHNTHTVAHLRRLYKQRH